jgi:hypothetical protein
LTFFMTAKFRRVLRIVIDRAAGPHGGSSAEP